MRKKLLVFLFLLFPCVVQSENIQTATGTANSTVVYSPTNVYECFPEKRGLIQANPQVMFLSTPQLYRTQTKESDKIVKDTGYYKSLEIDNLKNFKFRPKNPFKKVRRGINYLLGEIEYIDPPERTNIDDVEDAQPEDKIYGLSFLPCEEPWLAPYKKIAVAKDITEADQDWQSLAKELTAEIYQGSNGIVYTTEKWPVAGVKANAGTSIITAAKSMAAGPGHDVDKRQAVVGVNGGTSDSSAREAEHWYVRVTCYERAILEWVKKIQKEAEENAKKAREIAQGVVKFVYAPALFEFNKSTLLQRESDKIPNIAEGVYDWLMQNSTNKAFVAGFCDIWGGESYNWNLGGQRAQYVKQLIIDYLMSHHDGLDRKVLETRINEFSAGKMQAFYGKDDETQRWKDRRADIFLIGGNSLTSVSKINPGDLEALTKEAGDE